MIILPCFGNHVPQFAPVSYGGPLVLEEEGGMVRAQPRMAAGHCRLQHSDVHHIHPVPLQEPADPGAVAGCQAPAATVVCLSWLFIARLLLHTS